MGEKSILEKNVQRQIESEGITIGGKIIYGKVDATIHDDGTADIKVKSNGRVFECVIQLYVDGSWKVLE